MKKLAERTLLLVPTGVLIGIEPFARGLFILCTGLLMLWFIWYCNKRKYAIQPVSAPVQVNIPIETQKPSKTVYRALEGRGGLRQLKSLENWDAIKRNYIFFDKSGYLYPYNEALDEHMKTTELYQGIQ